MNFDKIKKTVNYIFFDYKEFPLENRLLISAIITGIFSSLLGCVISIIISSATTVIFTSFTLSLILVIAYYFVRVKMKFEYFVFPIIVFSIVGISIIWIFDGGINGANLFPGIVILILALIVVPDNNKKYVISFFIASVTIIYLIQLYLPDLIVGFPSEKARWTDSIITVICSSFFIFIIIKFLHKNYTIERQKAEESEKRFVEAQHIAKMGDFTWDETTNETTWSDGLYDLLKYDRTKKIDLAFVDKEIHHPDDLEDITQWWNTNYASGKELLTPKEYRLIRKDGELIYVRVEGVIQRNYDGSIKVLATVHDITERKQAEDALKESEEKHRFLFENTTLGVVYQNATGEIIHANKASERILGISLNQMQGLKSIDSRWKATHEDGTDYPGEEHPAMITLKTGQAINDEKMCVFNPINNSYTIININSLPKFKNNEIKPYQVVATFEDITDRKKAEKALIESEEKLNSIINHSPFPVAVVNLADDKIFYWSQSAYKLFGHTALTTKEWYEIAYPNPIYRQEVIERWKPFLEIAQQTKLPVNTGEYIVTCSNGSERICELWTTFIKNNLIVTFNDVTERKKSEQALKESEEKLNRSQKVGKIGHWEFDLNEKSSIWSNQVFALYERDMELGQPSDDEVGNYYSEKDHKRLREYMMQIIETAKPVENFECPIILPGGRIIITVGSMFPVMDSNGRIIKIFGVLQDITERKQAETEIRKLSEATKQSSVSIIITDTDGNIEFVNPFFTKKTGYTFEEIKGKNIRVLKSGHTTKKTYKELWSTITSGKTWQGEFLNVKKSKEKYWENAIISSITNENGEIINYLAIKEDITEKREAEQALKESEAKLHELNATKDKLFSIIAHDLRSPFNHILGFSELLIENVKDFEIAKSEKYLGIINSSANNTLILLDNLLNWAKSQTGKINFNPGKIIFSNVILEIIKLKKSIAKAKNISLNYSSSDEIEVYADENMLKTILRNLISNAIKFTNSNGKIDVTALQNNNFIEIAVSDNGVGMNDETRKKLFDISTNITTKGTANEKGSGLGLILCKEFVEKHGGKIWIESEEGKGSVFKFTLPNQIETIKENGDKNKFLPPLEISPINKLKILIVEDDETSEKLISIAVNKFGKEIISVRTGTEAVEVCRNNPDIDMVLMDIQLPGMNGYEATRQIREFNKNIVIIAQTAYALEGDREKAIAAGCNDYITKPIDREKLYEIIDSHFNTSSAV